MLDANTKKACKDDPSIRSLLSSFKLGDDSIELFSSGLSFESSKLVLDARSILHHKKKPTRSIEERVS